MAQTSNRRLYYPSELGAATSCPPSSEGAGRKRTPAMEHRAVLRPYLHGMEKAIGVTYNCRGELIGKRAVVRYADDFVCFCETREDAERVQGILVEWLKERGLTLSQEKTRIVHLTEGFEFLGFNIRHYPTPQTS
jgi:RNA-directed DNA polymerase